MPVSPSDSRCSRAAESTGSGNTAGPAEKLWIRCTVTESVEREGELGLEV
ncbi:MAG: hypothetical protein CM1200mP2_11360 [Planctomycetaceae bacterium]|nr:MAG: hypothetical protein CM1200mP2_11360 [Planctomycetaceae bacterium]